MRIILKVILFLGLIVICVTGLWFFFYEGTYTPPLVKKPSYEEITVVPPSYPKFTDVYQEGGGTVIIDLAHANDFTLAEINPLKLRIISRGSSIEYLQKEEEEAQMLEKKLRVADVLVVILPVDSYSEDEVKLVREFVEKGGKLLLIADPTRPGSINSLSSEFGLVFESGYLYKLGENEGNFRNIFISQFASSDLTKDLTKISLYAAGYISPATSGLAFTDDNTFASVTDTKGKLSPIALAPNSRVLAIADFTFMTEPHNMVYDNNKFISNITDWLATSERIFLLSDFPYCISDDVDITYSDPSVVDMATRLKALFGDIGKKAAINQREAPLTLSKDTVFLGLFRATEAVKSYLDSANISITAREEKIASANISVTDKEEKIAIEIGTMGDVYKKGTSVIYLGGETNKCLVILSDTNDMLKETVDLLEKGEFRQWLVTDRLAICRGKPIEPTEAP